MNEHIYQVKLPVKLGDTVFWITAVRSEDDGEVALGTCGFCGGEGTITGKNGRERTCPQYCCTEGVLYATHYTNTVFSGVIEGVTVSWKESVDTPEVKTVVADGRYGKHLRWEECFINGEEAHVEAKRRNEEELQALKDELAVG